MRREQRHTHNEQAEENTQGVQRVLGILCGDYLMRRVLENVQGAGAHG